jgi:hypothetical protein
MTSRALRLWVLSIDKPAVELLAGSGHQVLSGSSSFAETPGGLGLMQYQAVFRESWIGIGVQPELTEVQLATIEAASRRATSEMPKRRLPGCV